MQIDDDDDGRSGADRRGPASRRLLATNAPAAAVLAALVLFPACLRADDVQAIVRQQPWSCWFGGRTVTLRYQLAGPAAQAVGPPGALPCRIKWWRGVKPLSR